MKWNIIELIPEYDKQYLLYIDSGAYCVVYFWAISWSDIIKQHTNENGKVTHWAELPEPPPEIKKGE